MSKKAHFVGSISSNITGDKAIEGFYVTVDDEIWPTDTVVYKSYGGEITAFGYGHLTEDDSRQKKVLLQRIPDGITITVEN